MTLGMVLKTLLWIQLSFAQEQVQQSIKNELHPEVYRQAIEKREVYSRSRIENDRHFFYAVMTARKAPKKCFEVLSQYGEYEKFIPFVKESKYHPQDKTIDLKGGVFNYHIESQLKVTTETQGRIEFEIIRGHFKGLKGKILIEPLKKGDQCLIYLFGESFGKKWPPSFIMEQGAEMVLTISGRKLRGLVESWDRKEQEKQDGSQKNFPQPRSHL